MATAQRGPSEATTGRRIPLPTSCRTSTSVRRYKDPSDASFRSLAVRSEGANAWSTDTNAASWRDGAGWQRPRPIWTRCVGQDLNLRTPTGQDSEPCAFDQAGPPTHDAAGHDFTES